LSDFFEKYQRRRLITANISVVISIAVILFLLGFLGFFVLNSKKITNHFKEKITITVFFKDQAKLSEIKQFEKKIKLSPQVKKTKFITKKEAAAQLKKEIGEDFIKFLDFNPLQDNLEVNLNGEYVNEQKMDSLKQKWQSYKFVSEVNYEYYKPLIKGLNRNMKTLSFWIFMVSGIFLILVFLLINSAIRLSLYNKRFDIKTMQLVGATKSFIRKPFLTKAFWLGFTGAVLASATLYGILYYIDLYLPEFHFLTDYKLLGILFSSIFAIGIFITLISTYFATSRLLNIKSENLHF
jgi:cell division transport system permease protein